MLGCKEMHQCFSLASSFGNREYYGQASNSNN